MLQSVRKDQQRSWQAVGAGGSNTLLIRRGFPHRPAGSAGLLLPGHLSMDHRDYASSVASESRYVQGMERLLKAVQELSLARELADIQRIVRSVARELTGCDGATFVLNDGGSFCYYADEDAIAPLWKGKRFPQEMCISGWVMRNRQSVVIPDIFADPRIPEAAYRPTFVKSMAMVPIRTMEPVGAIGNYWAGKYQPTAEDVRLLQALADATSVAMENVAIYRELEQRVRARTEELTKAHLAIRELSFTDELTGLQNRRGFYEQAQTVLRVRARVVIAFIDADGLKAVNDTLGHTAGDAMLVEIADALRTSFRSTDVIARIGGDEFCVLIPEPTADFQTLRETFQYRLDELNAKAPRSYRLSASVGFVEAEGSGRNDLDGLLVEADRRMYEEKTARKMSRA